MRVGFAGTPGFAASALEAIIAAGFEVPLVLTQPDRAKGRGLHSEPSPVKRLAEDRGLPVLQPATLKTALARSPLLAFPLDVLVVAAYGLILPPEVLSWPRHGCLNIQSKPGVLNSFCSCCTKTGNFNIFLLKIRKVL